MRYIPFRKRWLNCSVLSVFATGMFCAMASAETVLVEAGRARAAIVIADDAPRLVELAAREVQDYLGKISGAQVPIGNAPDPAYPVAIHIGRSAFTDERGITADGLAHGAFRIVSGPDALVLLGRDVDFAPKEPWPRRHSEYPETQAAWEEVYGGPCANPMNWYGGPATSYNRAAGVWKQDEGGSLQAVYEFLRGLGVRWYMPGERGEVVPAMRTITLLEVDRTVRPDFAIRNLYWYNRFHVALEEDVLWWLRLGLNDGSSVLGASMQVHGMRTLQSNQAMKQAHPEYYALHRGRRETEFRGSGHACFSSPGLFNATVHYLRAAFDHFGEPAMDLWPQDAYHHCGCTLCAEQRPSDLVFGFVDRVAREVYKTHPDRLVTCGAYAEYAAPPETIETFSPNVAIYISNRGRPVFDMPARWQAYREQLAAWQAKLAPGRIIRGENNLYDRRLVIHPHAYARDLRALKGVSMGDICEVPRGRPPASQWHNMGINHLNYVIQARLLWDTGQDVDALLDEYCTLFYGPAADTMRAALDYAEQHYNRYRRVLELAERVDFVERLHAARAQAGDTIYGQRIQGILDEVEPLDELRAELQAKREAGDPRAKAPVAVAHPTGAPGAPPTTTFRPPVAYRYRETVANLPVTFTVTWTDDALTFDIRCHEPDMAHLETNGNVWEGDSVIVFLETPRHSHYMIQVAPDGRVFDAERNDAGRLQSAWSSMADVKTEHEPDGWRVRLRIPLAVVEPDAEYGDPLHHVVAPKPGTEGEWFFNVGRTRIRDGRRMVREEGYTPFAFSRTPGPIHLLEEFPPEYFARLEFAAPATEERSESRAPGEEPVTADP